MKVARDSFLTSGLRSGRWRRGSSLLEVQIAFALLGIGLAGLCPFVVMQLKQLVNLESRFMATSYTFHSDRGGFLHGTVLATSELLYDPILHCIEPACTPTSILLLLYRSLEQPLAQKLTTRAQLLTTSSNTSDPTVTSQPAAGFPHVTQPQAVSLTLDGNGNVTAVTAVVQVN